MKATVRVDTTVEIEVDDEVVTRCVDNVDGWSDNFYPLDTPEKVFEHLAHNVVRNHLDINQMDGWADLPATAMTSREIDGDVEVESVGP